MLYWLATSKVPSGNGFLNTSYRMISLLRQDDKSIRCIETLLSVHPHLSKVLDISLHRESGVWPRYPSAAKPLWLFLSENAFVAGNLVFWCSYGSHCAGGVLSVPYATFVELFVASMGLVMSRWFERPPSTTGVTSPRLTCSMLYIHVIRKWALPVTHGFVSA